MKNLTEEVASFLLKGKEPPGKVKEMAITHIIDGIAVMVAGSRSEATGKLVDYIKERGSKPSSSIIGFPLRTGISDAALINGTSGHADDYDDTQLSKAPDRIYGLLTHPTVPVLAAALAVGEARDSSGEVLLKAFIDGFEVECKLAEAIKPEHYQRGFHTTATIGTFGSMAATAKLMNLDERALRYSIGIASSLSSGIRANFGTMTKPLHAGMAASNGILACQLGSRGFTSDRRALDGEWGFMNILGGGAEPERLIGKMGNPYSIVEPGATIKMYPCGSLAQPSMDAILELVKDHDLKPDDVEEIRLYAGPNILGPLRYNQPANALEAKFSLQFALATILLCRRAGIKEYTIQWVKNKRLREEMKKVKTIHDEEIEAMGTDRMRSRIEVDLVSGEMLEKFADTARGMPEKPLKQSDIEEKYHECASIKMGDEAREELLSTLINLEELSEITELTSLLRT
ncbi:MAG: MmgE/PrpD family protein [Candidatus Bathyarchaeia archaeon]